MSVEPESSPVSQQLVNGDTDGTGYSSSSLHDSKHNEIKEAVDRTATLKTQPDTRPQPSPQSYQDHEAQRQFLQTGSNQNPGYNAHPPLRRSDSRSFQPPPSQPRPGNPLNFQPAQGWQRPPSAPFQSNSPGLLNSPTENRPFSTESRQTSGQYSPATEPRSPQPGQFNPNTEFRPTPQQYAPRPPQIAQGSLDPSRKVSFNPNPAGNPNNPPRQLQPGGVRRPSPWSVLKDKIPADQVRPPIRPYQFQNYNPMNPQPPSQTPPQDPQKRIDSDGTQRSYLPQEPGKPADILRTRSPMPPPGGRDSPTPPYVPGQQPPPRPVMMQRTDSVQSLPRGDPRLQQPFPPRPPRSPGRYDDDDVVVAGDPRMMMPRGSPRPPAPTGSPFNKYPGQDSPRNMSSPLGDVQKYLNRSDSNDSSKNITPSQSPFPQGMPRTPTPNKPDYQNSPVPSPKPTFPSATSTPIPQTSPQPQLLRSTITSPAVDKPLQESSSALSTHEDKPRTPFNQSLRSTPDSVPKTPEPPKSSPTPTPPAPTKPPEDLPRPDTPVRNPIIDRSGTPAKISSPSPILNMPERPSSLKRTPSEKDTPVVNGTNSELSSGRTSRTDSIQDGVMNARNLDKTERTGSSQRARIVSAKTSKDGDHDSGVDESTQGHEATTNGEADSPKKSSTKIPTPKKLPVSPTKSMPKTPTKTTPKTPETPGDKKKMPMNKIQVGAAPSPNLKVVKSKIGSFDNTSYKPGGGKVKIENRKLDWKAQPRIAAKNDTYTPGGGDKKIQQVKLQWTAKSKIGSLDNATHKPGGGDKKIESVKLDFKDKAKPKIGSKDNIKHIPGGGTVKVNTFVEYFHLRRDSLELIRKENMTETDQSECIFIESSVTKL